VAPIFESNFSYESQPYWLLSEETDPGFRTMGEGYNAVDTAPLQLGGGGGSSWDVHWSSLGII